MRTLKIMANLSQLNGSENRQLLPIFLITDNVYTRLESKDQRFSANAEH